MFDFDFAHGVPPQRFPCKRPQASSNPDHRSCARKNPNQNCDQNRRAIHWSLDEGRWIFNEAGDSKASAAGRAATEKNPFVCFKKFVDKRLGALNFAKARRELNEARLRSEQDTSIRWTGQIPDSDAQPATPRSDAVKTARYYLGIADLLIDDSRISLSRIQRLFQDDEYENKVPHSSKDRWLAAGGAWYFMPEVGDILPSAAALCRPPAPPPPQWLSVEWFKRSPYSPIHVEAIETLPGPKDRWRAAFEDLMTASLDRPMISLESTLDATGRQNNPSQAAGIDWMLSMQTRRILPPLLPSLYCSQGPRLIETNVVGRAMRHDYRDFNNLVDEIWMSNRTVPNPGYTRGLQQVFEMVRDRRGAEEIGPIYIVSPLARGQKLSKSEDSKAAQTRDYSWRG